MRFPPPHLEYESSLWQAGIITISGLDEAGRGALAGPVAAGAVILPVVKDIQVQLAGVRDSKLMSPRQREQWAERIRLAAVAWGVGMASNDEIDRIGILPATRLAMQRALELLSPPPQYLLIDSLILREDPLPQCAVIHGDRLCLSIAAASVLAKTARDMWMREIASTYPGYGFERHKGYGTKQHLAALECMGPTPLHRRSFAPLQHLPSNPDLL